MTQSTYSWMGTRIHLVLEDEFAEAYNRAQDAFQNAQLDHKERTGQQWTGHEPIRIDWTDEESKAWDGFARIINLIIEVNGPLDIPESEVTSDYLVKL